MVLRRSRNYGNLATKLRIKGRKIGRSHQLYGHLAHYGK